MKLASCVGVINRYITSYVGAFGRVYKGKITETVSGLSSVSYTQVAIKTLKRKLEKCKTSVGTVLLNH